jgi:putative transcriptional regulator
MRSVRASDAHCSPHTITSKSFCSFFLSLDATGHHLIRFKLAEQIEKKQFRESRRITIQEVAEATGINRMTLSKILNHRGYSTGTDILDKLCAYFGCRLEELAEHVPE